MDEDLRDRHHRLGADLRIAGRPDAALRELEKALAEDPNHADSHAEVALCHSERGDRAAALRSAERAVECDPGAWFAHYALGWILMGAGRLPEAVRCAEAALAIIPENGAALRLLAYVRSDLGEHPAAVAAADEARALDPESTDTHLCRSYVLRRAGDLPAARAEAEAALARSPGAFGPHVALAICAERLHDWKTAGEEYRESLRLRPDDSFARGGLVRVLRQRSPVYRGWMWVEGRWDVLGRKSRIAAFAGLAVCSCGWVLIVGLVYVLLRSVARGAPADPLADVILRFDRYGRQLLTPAEIAAADRMTALLAGSAALVVALVCGAPARWLAGAPLAAMAVVAACVVPNCSPGQGRLRMAGYLLLVAGAAAGAVVLAGMAKWSKGPDGTIDDATGGLLWLTALSAAGFVFAPDVARRLGYPWSHRFDLTPQAA